jgi:hypothetical protein
VLQPGQAVLEPVLVAYAIDSLTFGLGGLAAAGFGLVAHRIGLVEEFRRCAWLPAFGPLTFLLPRSARSAQRERRGPQGTGSCGRTALSAPKVGSSIIRLGSGASAEFRPVCAHVGRSWAKRLNPIADVRQPPGPVMRVQERSRNQRL